MPVYKQGFKTVTNLKQFFFDTKDRRTVERGIGGYYNADTTAVSTTSTTRVNLKTYNFNSSAKTNKIRVRVYAYVSGTVSGSSIYLNINGTDVAGPVTVTETSATLKIDYIGDIPSSSSITIKVDGLAESGYTLYVSKVVIIAGFGLTSTTSVNILSITLDSANDVYNLSVSGDFVYKLGLRWWITGNRKTTASATIVSNLTNEGQSLTYKAGAGDDGDNNAIIQLRTGDYATSFTISGYVGASDDTIIITGVYCHIVLRSVNDSLNLTDHHVLIKEKGVAFISSIHATIDGSSTFSAFYSVGLSGANSLYNTASGSFVKVSGIQLAINNEPECTWRLEDGRDIYGRGVFLYVNIIVIGN